MSFFTISGVTCGGCEARVTRAAKTLDADAVLRFSADRRQLEVISAADPDDLAEAITAQGYPTVPVAVSGGH